jgi:hypothetical protein
MFAESGSQALKDLDLLTLIPGFQSAGAQIADSVL